MKDILLTSAGDLHIAENGDISLTDSIAQAARIRVQWFFEEWRYGPELGIPFFEEIFVKSPDLESIRQIINNEIMSIDGVSDVKDIDIKFDKFVRKLTITLVIVVGEEAYREELVVNV